MPGLNLGDLTPNFAATTTEGDIKFHDFIGDGWCVPVRHDPPPFPCLLEELVVMGRIRPVALALLCPGPASACYRPRIAHRRLTPPPSFPIRAWDATPRSVPGSAQTEECRGVC